MTFSGSGYDPSIFWIRIRIRIRIRILALKIEITQLGPEKNRITVHVIRDTSVPGSQRIKIIISSTGTKKGNMKKDYEKEDYEKEDYNKRTTAGSGSRSGSGIAHTDPDPQHCTETFIFKN